MTSSGFKIATFWLVAYNTAEETMDISVINWSSVII
jgi:hypothetical protein